MKVKNTKSSILNSIFHLEPCEFTSALKRWICKQKNTKHVLWKIYIGPRGYESCTKGQNLGKMEVKNTKWSILRPILHLEWCKYINGLISRCGNTAIQILYFAMLRLVVEALKPAKKQNKGQIYKIVNFEANFPFGAL